MLPNLGFSYADLFVVRKALAFIKAGWYRTDINLNCNFCIR